MKIIEDEVIGELRYLTVEFDRTDLTATGAGVVSQGAVRRYFEKFFPDLKVKKCGGLKLDSQRDIVTMRIGVVKEKELVDSPDPVNGDREVKLLNPGYDELKNNYDLLVAHNDRLVDTYKELKEKYDALKTDYEARMTKAYNEGTPCPCDKCKDDRDQSDEDSADLADAEKVLAEGDFVDGPFSTSAPTAEEVAKEGIKIIAAEQGIDCNPDDCGSCKDHACNVEGEGDDSDEENKNE